jgi:hypothetical protein
MMMMMYGLQGTRITQLVLAQRYRTYKWGIGVQFLTAVVFLFSACPDHSASHPVGTGCPFLKEVE